MKINFGWKIIYEVSGRHKSGIQTEGESVDRKSSIIETISQIQEWNRFLEYKVENQHLNHYEAALFREYIEDKRFLKMKAQIDGNCFPEDYPIKKIVNKEGTNKKRIVYSFSNDIGITLKFLAFQLYAFDDLFSDNCYAFRRTCGVGDALKRILRNPEIPNQYCLKADISNYFNSIDTRRLLESLIPVKHRDEPLYHLFERILLEERVWEQGRIISDRHGAMAGIPIAPFFANIYLADLDKHFSDIGVEYFRYSDDILIFADSEEELLQIKSDLYNRLYQKGLFVNPEKEKIAKPGEKWEFLGFSYQERQFDLSDNTKRKIKGKIRRKAEALRRWQRKKRLTSDKAAIGFIRAMNRKFYGSEESDDFTWSRWFFPNLTIDTGLREIDRYMQEYIRYAVTGRHYKGNYRISYEKMKEWGYHSLVHEYYQFRKEIGERGYCWQTYSGYGNNNKNPMAEK